MKSIEVAINDVLRGESLDFELDGSPVGPSTIVVEVLELEEIGRAHV